MSDTPESRFKPTGPYAEAEAAVAALDTTYIEKFGHESHQRNQRNTDYWFLPNHSPRVTIPSLPDAHLVLRSVSRVKLDAGPDDLPTSQASHFISFYGYLSDERGVLSKLEEDGSIVPASLEGDEEFYEVLLAPEFPPVLVQSVEFGEGDLGDQTTQGWQSVQKFPLTVEDIGVVTQAVIQNRDFVGEVYS